MKQQEATPLPGLDDPESFLPSSGFTVTQQSALLSLVAVSDLSSLAETISSFCDRRSWEVVKCSLIGTANSDGEDTVVSRGELPTKTTLLSAEASHPWRRALRSFLESPKVQLRPQALLGLHLLSLKDIVILYNQAKEEAMAEEPNDTFNEPILSTVDSRDALFLLSKTSAEIKTIELTFSPATKRFDLRDVGQIVKAEFGYTSLTSTLTDITAELSAHQMKVHGECARDNDCQHPFSGWLPVSEALLVRFRNQNAASHAGDALRRKVVGVGSFGFAGQNVLRLQYRPMSDRMTHVETNACSSLCKLLEQKGAVDGNVHNNPGHFTWFKLAEWMLVDIVEKLGSSLDHCGISVGEP